jgi:hypothetical protein
MKSDTIQERYSAAYLSVIRKDREHQTWLNI